MNDNEIINQPVNKILSSNLLITGVVRNVEKTLEYDFLRISEAFSRFKEVEWFIVESDSEDETINELNAISAIYKNFKFKSLGNLRNSIPKRTERIAFARNAYLDEIETKYTNVDFVVVCDLDGINSKLTQKSVNSCWENIYWDVCAANQDYNYYDISALRHNFWSSNNWIDSYNFFVEAGISRKTALRNSLYSRMIRIPSQAKWIEVDSAFGGIAIYRRQVLNNARYFGLDTFGNEVCEHVAFHQKIKSIGGKIYINPRFINSGVTDHTQILRPSIKLKIFLKNLLKRFI